jgi:hypothetical protein
MKREEKLLAMERQARDRSVHGWAFRALDKPDQFILNHQAIHEAEPGACRPCDEVCRWKESQGVVEAIRAFLDGGPCPEDCRRGYALAREQLKLGPKDWYEAYAEAAHYLVPGWNAFMDLTGEQERFCEMAADSKAERPEEER